MALPQNTTGNTFSHIYGTNTSPLETLLIKRKIKGPSWLVVQQAEVTPVGSMRCNTKLELRVGGPRAVSPLADLANKDTPTLGVMSINLKTIANDKHQQEVVMCSLYFQGSVNMDGPTSTPITHKFCAVRKLNNGTNSPEHTLSTHTRSVAPYTAAFVTGNTSNFY